MSRFGVLKATIAILRFWLSLVGCGSFLLVGCCWLVVVGCCWLLLVGCCWLFVVGWLVGRSVVVGCLLVVFGRYSSGWLLLVGCRWLVVVGCGWLVVVGWLLLVGCC